MGLLGHTLVYTYYMHFSMRTFVPVIAALKPGRTLVNRLFATPLRPFGILMSITPHNRCTWLHGARETPTGSTWLHGAMSSGFSTRPGATLPFFASNGWCHALCVVLLPGCG